MGVPGAGARYEVSPEFVYCPRSKMFVLADLKTTTPPCELPVHRPWYWKEDVSLAEGCTIWRARVRQERARLERERQAETIVPDTEDIVREGEPKQLVFDESQQHASMPA